MTLLPAVAQPRGYQCRRNLETLHAGLQAVEMTRQCTGRMVATMTVVDRAPALTCDACGRGAAAEVTA